MQHLSCSVLSVLIVAVFIPISHALPYLAIANITTIQSSLVRRECTRVLSESPDVFECDNEMPKLSEMISHMLSSDYSGTVTESSAAFFYSNVGVPDSDVEKAGTWMMGWLKSQGVEEYYWVYTAAVKCKQVWPSPKSIETGSLTVIGFVVQRQWIISHNEAIIQAINMPKEPMFYFMNCFFEALALAVIHPKVYLFTKDGEEPQPGSTWTVLEFPALTRNQNVKEIYRVDARPPEVRGVDPADCDPPTAKLMWSRERGDPVASAGWVCPWS